MFLPEISIGPIPEFTGERPMKNGGYLRLLTTPLLALLATSGPAHAAGTAVSGAKIATIHLETGVPYLFFDQPISNPDGCTSNSRVVLANDLLNREGYLSLAMTALASGKLVAVFVSGCIGSPWGVTLPKVYAMRILP